MKPIKTKKKVKGGRYYKMTLPTVPEKAETPEFWNITIPYYFELK